MRKVISAVCVLSAVLLSHEAMSWEPKRPIQLVVGFAAGGGTDVIARNLAIASQGVIPVPIVVVNRTGAAGVIAAEYVAKASPDGHTLLTAGGSESTSIPNYQKVSYTLNGSFRPIIHMIRLRMMIVTRAEAPYKNFKDFVSYAKANPGKLAFGTAGVGGLAHSAWLLINKTASIDTFDVPYKGDAETVTALLGNQIHVTQVSPDQAKPWVDSGRMRLLAVTSNDRFPGNPDVPTLKELGYDVYLDNMKGVVAPAGLPDDVYAYLHDNFRKAMATDTFKSLAAKSNFEVAYMDGPTFGKAMQGMSNAIATGLKK